MANNFFSDHYANFSPTQLQAFKKTIEESRYQDGGELFELIPDLNYLTNDREEEKREKEEDADAEMKLAACIDLPEQAIVEQE